MNNIGIISTYLSLWPIMKSNASNPEYTIFLQILIKIGNVTTTCTYAWSTDDGEYQMEMQCRGTTFR